MVIVEISNTTTEKVHMKKIFTFLLFIFAAAVSFSQKINGQWRGYFDSRGDIVANSRNNTEYVLELEINDTEVSGFSYSYFQNRRYFVICKLDGTFDKSTKSIKVTEIERTKGNTPPDFSDCLQTHILTYKKDGTEEELVGRWETAPGQRATCGVGTTTLTRRTLSKDLSSFNAAAKKQPEAVTAPPKKLLPAEKKTMEPAAVKNTAKQAPAKKLIPSNAYKTAVVKNKPAEKITPSLKHITTAKTAVLPPVKTNPLMKDIARERIPSINKIESFGTRPDLGYEKRKAELLKSIEIEHETFTLTFYDNGAVDGDSISVFYNGKLILAHQRLTEKPLSVTLDANSGKAINELTMYAENLGEIAPNTALMVVMDGEKRYELRISSDLKNSGTIHFIHTPKTQ